MHHKKAFTLIELLVVIAIIALLLAVLLPSLARARKQARSSVCLSNLKGLGVAVYVYANDNDDRLPGVGLSHGGSASDGQGSWLFTMQKQYGNELIARCPSDESAHWEVPLQPDGPLRRVSFGTNYYTAGRIGKRDPINKLSAFRTPGATIWLGELAETGAFAVADHVHPETWFSNPRSLASKELALDRHLQRSNFLHLDGHAKSLKFQETFLINSKNSRFPNIAWINNRWDPLIAR